MNLVRLAWQVAEPVHAVLYYAPETAAATAGFALPNPWMTYFGCRVAPLGRVSASAATAVCYHLAPSMVSGSVPGLWEHAAPQRFLDARLEAVDLALARLLPEVPRRLLHLARSAASAVQNCGRALAAANAALPEPSGPRPALWQALTTMREYRGDGHIAALIGADVDPCAAHVLADAAGRAPESQSKRYHKWDETAWKTAREALTARGWLGADGSLTRAGRAAAEEIEQTTDRLARRPYSALGDAATEEFVSLLRPLADAVMAAGAVPVPNPVGFSWPPR
ncbi:SCO6745 family protein [Amycolatopsis sp.]|uniref:SCO6745 family protein n=1 Tax=Amycolatopsis sp. TaxID=37632 RepID=UPI0039C887FC